MDLSTWHNYLTGGIVSPEAFGPADIRHLLSIGPTDVPRQSSVTFFAVLVGGHSVEDVLANVDAARSKYRSLRDSIRHGEVLAIEVWPAGPPSGDRFSVGLLFDAPVNGLFDASQTFCSGSQPELWKISGQGRLVFVFFQKAQVDPWIDDGDDVLCVGRLADGTLFAGSTPGSSLGAR
jgi:hypothetical protein